MRTLPLLLGLALFSCQSTGTAPQDPGSMKSLPEDIEFETLGSGNLSGLDGTCGLVIRSDAEWQRLWGAHCAIQTGGPPCPEVDFEREMVVAWVLGDRPTAGYGVTVESVRRDGDRLVVEAVESGPPEGMMAAQVITRPNVFVRVPRHDGSIELLLH